MWSMGVANIKALGLVVSDKKIFFHVAPYIYVKHDPQGGAIFCPRGLIWTNYVEVHQMMLHTK